MRQILFLLFAICCTSTFGQTYRYKRIMIVDGSYKKNVNDDAHYITFNNKGCYESDSKGYAETGNFISFTKNEIICIVTMVTAIGERRIIIFQMIIHD